MGKRTYTPEHDAFLMRHPILDRVILAALFNREFNENRSVEAIRNHCRRQLGLKMINRARFSKHKIGKRFKKGECAKGCEKGWFKAGHDIHSHGIGHEFIKEGRVYIKVTCNLRPSMKNFKPKARWVWEHHHGEIPKGMIITFKDNNPMNCDISNLLLIPRSEFSRLIKKFNFANEPSELKPVIRSLSLLEKTIKEKQCKQQFMK